MGDTILLKTVVVEGALDIGDLTDTTVGGVGVFDRMLTTMKAHLQIEYELGRITGSDYSNVFLGAYQTTLQQAASFLLEKEKQAYELDKLNSDRDLVLAQIRQTDEQTLLIRVQTQNAELEASKIAQEIQQLGSAIGYTEAQTQMLTVQTEYEQFKNTYIQPQELAQITQQVANLTSQGKLIESQNLQTIKQTEVLGYDLINKAPIEVANLTKQGLQFEAQTALTTEQTSTVVYDRTFKSPVELANLTKQGNIMDQQILVQQQEVLVKQKEVELATAKLANDTKTLDLLIAQIAAQQSQSALYAQKVITEKAQVDNSVVGANSSIDQQNKLLSAQREGYARDAEQKAAKLMIDTWNVRRNDDSATAPINFINLLADKNVGIAVQAMFTGMGHPAATA